jgi:hypothetical protein
MGILDPAPFGCGLPRQDDKTHVNRGVQTYRAGEKLEAELDQLYATLSREDREHLSLYRCTERQRFHTPITKDRPS